MVLPFYKIWTGERGGVALRVIDLGGGTPGDAAGHKSPEGQRRQMGAVLTTSLRAREVSRT